MSQLEPHDFIRTHTRLRPIPSLPDISIYSAHEATGLWRLAADDFENGEPPPPYWAFPWAGGLTLARYILDNPHSVSGCQVLDLGSGSGLVAIAAAKAGAAAVSAADTDPYAVAAIGLNAAANNVAIAVIADNLLGLEPPKCDVVLVGDLFYERDLADRVTAFLDRCLAAGARVLIGDPGRAYLPQSRLISVAAYVVPDVGEVESSKTQPSSVFAFEPVAR